MNLAYSQSLIFHPSAPFHFDSSLHKPDHFPSTDNRWVPGVRWQTMLWRGESLGLKFEDAGSQEAPCVRLNVWSEQPLEADFLQSLIEEIDWRYNFSLDLSEFYACFAPDLQLGPAMHRWRGMRPMNPGSLYEYLLIAIVLQNATVRRSVNMLQALFEAFGTSLEYDGQKLSCFWPPEALRDVPEEWLRALKIGYRAKSILRVSQAFYERQIDEFALRNAALEEQREALLALYGIGPASVGYILFDVFHRWDDFRHISPWEQKIYSKMFFDRTPDDPVPVAELLALFEQRFSPWRMVAVHYLWEDLWWRRVNEPVEWLEQLIRL
jgi:3-methyladenine DNA glycosylase/8-oxoguanine DNA glycosylase